MWDKRAFFSLLPAFESLETVDRAFVHNFLCRTAGVLFLFLFPIPACCAL